MAGKPGMRQGGNNRKPTALKLLRETLKPSRVNLNEPQPAVKLPKPPAEVGPIGRKEWRRVGRHLLQLGIVSELDMVALALYAKTWERWIEAERQLTKFGTVIIKDNFPVQSPYLRIATEAMVQLKNLLIEFGMTPASRSRVSAKPKPLEDKFAEYEQASK